MPRLPDSKVRLADQIGANLRAPSLVRPYLSERLALFRVTRSALPVVSRADAPMAETSLAMSCQGHSDDMQVPPQRTPSRELDT